MADEFVRIGQFEESLRRIDERFVGLEKKMEQGFAHAAKEREQISVHLSQRFDDLKESVSERFDGLEKRFDDQRRIVVLLLSAIVTAVGAGALAGVAAAFKYVILS